MSDSDDEKDVLDIQWIINLKNHDGYSWKKLSNETNKPIRTLKRWYTMYYKENRFPRTHSGRPKKRKRELKYKVQEAMNNGTSMKMIVEELKGDASRRTIYRIAKNLRETIS